MNAPRLYGRYGLFLLLLGWLLGGCAAPPAPPSLTPLLPTAVPPTSTLAPTATMPATATAVPATVTTMPTAVATEMPTAIPLTLEELTVPVTHETIIERALVCGTPWVADCGKIMYQTNDGEVLPVPGLTFQNGFFDTDGTTKQLVVPTQIINEGPGYWSQDTVERFERWKRDALAASADPEAVQAYYAAIEAGETPETVPTTTIPTYVAGEGIVMTEVPITANFEIAVYITEVRKPVMSADALPFPPTYWTTDIGGHVKTTYSGAMYSPDPTGEGAGTLFMYLALPGSELASQQKDELRYHAILGMVTGRLSGYLLNFGPQTGGTYNSGSGNETPTQFQTLRALVRRHLQENPDDIESPSSTRFVLQLTNEVGFVGEPMPSVPHLAQFAEYAVSPTSIEAVYFYHNPETNQVQLVAVDPNTKQILEYFVFQNSTLTPQPDGTVVVQNSDDTVVATITPTGLDYAGESFAPDSIEQLPNGDIRYQRSNTP